MVLVQVRNIFQVIWENENTDPQGAAKTGYVKGGAHTDVTNLHSVNVNDGDSGKKVGRTTNIIYRRGNADIDDMWYTFLHDNPI